jgi:hypothetical protein
MQSGRDHVDKLQQPRMNQDVAAVLAGLERQRELHASPKEFGV